MIIQYLTIVAGFILVLALADIIVKAALRLSKHYGWSGSFVGLTILSIGTSIPEIISAVAGSIQILYNNQAPTISALILGQNVGSDIFQQSIILSAVALVGTVIVIKKDLHKEMGVLIAGAIIVLLFAVNGMITRFEGLLLLLCYAAYLVYLYLHQDKVKKLAKYHLSKSRVIGEISLILLGFIAMGYGANKVLVASQFVLAELPISASFFGVILLGVASALPELTTALIGVFKKETGMSAGVLIGSNITNPLMGLGLGALISGYLVPDVLIKYDLPFKIGTAFLIYYFLARHEKLEKWQAIVLITLFVAYILVRNYLFPIDF